MITPEVPLPAPTGSPPHAWGQCRQSWRLGCDDGSSPHAWGQWTRYAASPRSTAVHPHMRGDNETLPIKILRARGSPPHAWGQSGRAFRKIGLTLGSPPHAWGQWATHAATGATDRFTPTCVGTIVRSVRGFGRWTVHPHMRGDNGSSRPRERRYSVHPHMRGDNDGMPQNVDLLTGSPPHAWGQ